MVVTKPSVKPAPSRQLPFTRSKTDTTRGEMRPAEVGTVVDVSGAVVGAVALDALGPPLDAAGTPVEAATDELGAPTTVVAVDDAMVVVARLASSVGR